MASKVNRKFVLVVGGFAAAAVLLLVAVILVNQLWIKNAERHIRAGDELMAQGKLREAYGMYGRAVQKKPNEVAYIGKMEEALGGIVADTPGQAVDDYRSMVGLKRARTRAQPADPEQWRQLIRMLDAEGDLFPRGEGWMALESVGKEMKDAVGAGGQGLDLADETVLISRARREQSLGPSERTELDRQLEEHLKSSPKSWRAWAALVDLRAADVARLRGSGQQGTAARRVEQLDKALAGMGAAVDPSDAEAQQALALVRLARVLLDGQAGTRIDRSKLDAAALDAAVAAVREASLKSPNGTMARSTARMIGESKGIAEGTAFLEAWSKANPDDVVSETLLLDFVSRSPDPERVYERTQEVARRILDRPGQRTGLQASVQGDSRNRALQVLIDAALVRLSQEKDAAKKQQLEASVGELRTKLLALMQNDEAAPSMLAADAKLAQSKGDLSAAAKNWDLYFTKVPQPPADAFLWATTVARARNDLGLALQRATRGTEAFPGDLRLAVQRAEVSAQLGRFQEAAALYDSISAGLGEGSDGQFARFAAEARARADGGVAAAAPEVGDIDGAVNAKDFDRARQLAADWVKSSGGNVQAMFAQVLVEQRAGDNAKALELARAALEKHPANLELARVEAMLATEDPVERVDILVNRMIADPKQRPLERVRALRGLRADLIRQIDDLRRSNSPDLARSEQFLARIDAVLPKAETDLAQAGADDPAGVELAFMQAISRDDVAAAEQHLAAAARLSAVSPILETVLRARLLDYQGRTAEALAVLQAARQAGRDEAPLSAATAACYERLGNEPEALAAWKSAYDRRPNDLANVGGYVRALGRSGQGRIALDLLRPAVAANPNDAPILMLAAQYEAVYGSRAKAIEHRQRALQLDPTNRENIGDLYALYYAPADFGAVRNPAGRVRFDARTWAAVPAAEQRRLLADAEAMHAALAEQLYEQAMKIAPLDVRLAGRKATVLREYGKIDEATKALGDVIARAEAEGKATSLMYTEQGLYLDSIGDKAGSDAALAKAASLQDPKRREVDLVVVELEAKRGNAKRAAELLRGAVGASPQAQSLLRLADLEIVASEFDAATATIEKARALMGAKGTPDQQRQLEMLAAGLASGQADVLRKAGKLDEARVKAEQALAAVGRAEVLAPTDLFIPLRRVQLLRAMSVGQQDPSKLDLAIAEADRSLGRNAMYWPMVSARTDLSLDKRDIRGAITIVERFLQAQPGSDEARRRAIELQVASGSLPRAVELARGAMELRPQDPEWAERLGDLLEASGDAGAAAREFERAFTLNPKSKVYLEKAALSRLRSGGANEALVLLRGANALVERSAVLRAIAAAALAQAGRRDEALVAAREAVTSARASADSLDVQRAVVVLNAIFPPDRPAEMEAFLLQSGTPSPAEAGFMADAWLRTGPTGVPKALEWCARVDALGDSVPPSIRSLNDLNRGTALYLQGKLDEACDAFERAVDFMPNNVQALNNAAYLLAKVRKNFPKAYEYASKAVLLAPAQPDYLDSLGYVLLLSGRMDEAEEVLTKSVDAAPTASALLHLAQVRAAKGADGDARQLIDRARNRPADPDIAKEIEAFSATLSGK